VGDSALVTMGRSRLTRAELADFIRTLRALCAGETVQGPAGEMRLVFGAPDRCPPVLIAGAGPKMLRLAGEIADGAIVTGTAVPGETLRSMLASVREGRRKSGRERGEFSTYLAVAVAVHRDRSTALAAVRPHVARSLLTHPWPLSEAAQRASEAIRASYDFYEHMSPTARHGELVPDEVVAEFAIAGTPNDCLERVTSLFESGVQEITVRPYAANGDSRADMIEVFAREVMEPYRKRSARGASSSGRLQ
jgi:5,10-methylenetetrahydromethanopterin reductase